MQRVLWGLLAIWLTGTQAYASQCEGEACSQITYKFRDGCFYFYNAGDRPVTIVLAGIPIVLPSKETRVIRGQDPSAVCNDPKPTNKNIPTS
jgi:hypothetical protein